MEHLNWLTFADCQSNRQREVARGVALMTRPSRRSLVPAAPPIGASPRVRTLERVPARGLFQCRRIDIVRDSLLLESRCLGYADISFSQRDFVRR